MESAVEKKVEAVNEKSKSDSFRDHVSTVDQSGKRVWLYPQKPKGKLHDKRAWFTALLLIVFFGLPFIKVNGDPLFMFNIIERKFILFGMIFWPQDFFIFGLAFVIFIVFITLFTVVYGRVFCGWACPQTIFMEMVFRKIEYWIEGDSIYQKQLDKQEWNAEKILKRIGKYSAFAIISFIITNTMLTYIIGKDELFEIISEPISEHKGGFTGILLFTFAFLAVYAWFREQVCLIVCPYGRMQGVLLDKNSIVVAYDYERGDPREKFKKLASPDAGDCIDCFQCVKVCPTGIDIRNGTQLECINCTACIDACDHMMESVKRPTGLIRLTSENQIKNKTKFKLTTRMKAYSLVLILLMGIEAFLIGGRSDVDATVLRARGLLYQEQTGNRISNLYTIKILNKTREDLPIKLKIENIESEVQLIGKSLNIKKEGMVSGQFFVMINRDKLDGRKTKLIIGLYSGDKKIKTIKTSFLGPLVIK